MLQQRLFFCIQLLEYCCFYVLILKFRNKRPSQAQRWPDAFFCRSYPAKKGNVSITFTKLGDWMPFLVSVRMEWHVHCCNSSWRRFQIPIRLCQNALHTASQLLPWCKDASNVEAITWFVSKLFKVFDRFINYSKRKVSHSKYVEKIWGSLS